MARIAGPGRLLPALLSLLAFAANSILCRLALMQGAIDPESFTVLRLLGGGLFLLLLVNWPRPAPAAACQRIGGSWRGALALFVYAYLFSIAYLQLGAGAGALILFAAVQVTMFLYGCYRGERLHLRVLGGMLLAFAGLLVLLLPAADAPPLASALWMIAAGIAWGAYSLIGKGSSRPLADTAGNFLRSFPLLLLPLLSAGLSAGLHLTSVGVLYALASGVLASGAGYALWYRVVRQISAQQAATLQLGVPVIAALAGVVLLGEPISLRLALVAGVVLGGIALALLPGTGERR